MTLFYYYFLKVNVGVYYVLFEEKYISKSAIRVFYDDYCLQISYVLDTEDFFFRSGRKRKVLGERLLSHGHARVERFHRLLTSSL